MEVVTVHLSKDAASSIGPGERIRTWCGRDKLMLPISEGIVINILRHRLCDCRALQLYRSPVLRQTPVTIGSRAVLAEEVGGGTFRKHGKTFTGKWFKIVYSLRVFYSAMYNMVNTSFQYLGSEL